jgi:hypothetical protein
MSNEISGFHPGRRSYIKEEIDDIAVLHHIIPALLQQFPRLPDLLLIAQVDEVFVLDDLGPDESAFDVGMDDPGGPWGE